MTAAIQETKHQQKEGSKDVEMTEDRPILTPATDIYEKEDSILVLCDMPGVDEKNVDIILENDVLTLTGSQTEEEPKGQTLIYRGYWPGIYRRAFQLTTDVDRSKIKATMKNGVLQVVLPKSEKAQPRKIAVEASA
ncbi:MAG TPA: heat-shock protein Hsp20 [Verrucomicrobia bacterium]|nr:heat-shock protein Hsp20 [Verrucomicrobiota bacterium]